MPSNNYIGGSGNGQASEDGSGDRDREDAGLAVLEALSLEELATIAGQEIGEARRFQAEAVGLSRRSTVTLYRAGRALWCARKKLKGKGKRAWTRWQRDNGIPVTSAWQAIRLYEEAEGEEAVAGLTRSEALRKYRIVPPKKVRPSEPPVVSADTPPDTARRRQSGVSGGSSATPPDTAVQDREPGQDRRPEQDPDQDQGQDQDQGGDDRPTAAETLLVVVRRLEVLERDQGGRALDGEALGLIDRAIATLRRLKGDPPATEAA